MVAGISYYKRRLVVVGEILIFQVDMKEILYLIFLAQSTPVPSKAEPTGRPVRTMRNMEVLQKRWKTKPEKWYIINELSNLQNMSSK